MEAKARLGWVKLYQQTGDAGLVCRRCGISRPTLRKCGADTRPRARPGSSPAAPARIARPDGRCSPARRR